MLYNRRYLRSVGRSGTGGAIHHESCDLRERLARVFWIPENKRPAVEYPVYILRPMINRNGCNTYPVSTKECDVFRPGTLSHP